ncbi:MAG: hypothetical protein C0603_09960 [Denitrovibrio sp.]|nr:MAG: hypothetical protein C0603_09960 [Denitrovibrio sp.]
MIITAILGVIFQFIVFGVILNYVKRFASGAHITIHSYGLNLDIDQRKSISLLIFMVVMITLSLSLSALVLYFSRWGTIRLGSKYMNFSIERIFRLLASDKLVDKTMLFDADIPRDKYILRLITGDSRIGGRIVRMILDTTVPLTTFLIAFSALVYMHFVLTMAVVFILLFYTFVQYKITRKASNHTLVFDKQSPIVNRTCRDILESFMLLPGREMFHDDMIDDIMKSESLKKYTESYDGRISTIIDSKLASGLFTAPIIATVILLLGLEIIETGTGWDTLVVYILALRFAMISMQSVFSQITSVNRFYSQMRRLYHFVKSFEKSDDVKQVDTTEYNVHCDDKLLKGSLTDYKIHESMRIALVTQATPNRYSIADSLCSILGEGSLEYNSAIHRTTFVTERMPCPNGSLRELLRIQSNQTINDLNLPPNIISILAANDLTDINIKITEEQWSGLSKKIRFVISILIALRSDHQWIFVDSIALEFLNFAMVNLVNNTSDGKIIVVIFNDEYDSIGKMNEELVIVADEHSILGAGDKEWFESIKEHSIVAKLRTIKRRVMPDVLRDSEDYESEHKELYDDILEESKEVDIKEKYEINYATHNHMLEGADASLTLVPGNIVGLVMPASSNSSILENPYALGDSLMAIVGGDKTLLGSVYPAAVFIDENAENPNCSLREYLQMNNEETLQDIGFTNRYINRMKKLNFTNIDEPISDNIWGNSGRRLIFILKVVSALRSEKQFIFIDANYLSLTFKGFSEIFYKLIKGKIIIVVHGSDNQNIGTFNESNIIVVHDSICLGVGSLEWYNIAKESVNLAALEELSRFTRAKGDIEYDEKDQDDDFDDMEEM